MRLTELAHKKIEKYIGAGDTVIDASAGNGYDTVFLAQRVSHTGKVYAFDVQHEAIVATQTLLAEKQITWVELIHANHAELANWLPSACKVRAVMFNLGYLPKSNKTITTQAETTLPALQACLPYLDYPAIISILAYRAHSGGNEEYLQVKNWLATLDDRHYTLETYSPSNTRNLAPVLMTLTTLPRR